jgi:hypothetical protein
MLQAGYTTRSGSDRRSVTNRLKRAYKKRKPLQPTARAPSARWEATPNAHPLARTRMHARARNH